MKIKIKNIKFAWYDPREEIDKEYINELSQSIEKDGLWNPILVKSNNDSTYNLISGGHRLRAIKKLGWDEVEANVLDVDDTIASILAIKTNLLQKNLSDIEEAKAIKRIIDEFGLTQSEIAEKLNKSQAWVSNRLSLILDVSNNVQIALSEDKISTSHAVLISKLSKIEQDDFLSYILKNKLNINESKIALKKYENRIIYTIGYQGKKLDELITILKENNINTLIDIRESGKSSNLPHFNSEVLKREFEKININYYHKPELGVIYQVRAPYIEGFIDHNAFNGWYKWHLKNINFEIESFLKFLKDNDKCCLLCMEKYAKPFKNQKHYCHRDILTDIILNAKTEDKLLKFKERIDL